MAEDEGIDPALFPAESGGEVGLVGGVAQHAGEVEATPLRVECGETGVVGGSQRENGVGWLGEVGFAAVGDDAEVRERWNGAEELPSVGSGLKATEESRVANFKGFECARGGNTQQCAAWRFHGKPAFGSVVGAKTVAIAGLLDGGVGDYEIETPAEVRDGAGDGDEGLALFGELGLGGGGS